MEVIVLIKSARCYGANCTYTLMGKYLERGLGEYGPALQAIHAIACFQEGPEPQMYPGFHDPTFEFDLAKLPKVRFLRKKARIDLDYKTEATDGSFFERYGYYSSEVFSKALNELAHLYHLIDQRLKPSDTFDLPRFHGDIARLISAAPRSDDELRQLDAMIEQEEQQRLATMDPWERLEIDWEDYHPDARKLLNDPFLWSQIDGLSPHGNDTGADLLAAFVKWNRKHADHPAHALARKLLRDWEVTPIKEHDIDEAGVTAMLETDEASFHLTNEAIIAAAFAAVKLRGWCDAETRDLAIKAIARKRIAAEHASRSELIPEHLRRLDQLSEILERISAAPA